MLVTDRMVDLIEKVGRERSPNEACGLAFADGTVVELENVTELDPTCNFYLGGMVDVLKQLRAAGITDQMFEGRYMVWHTHPAGRIVGPSRTDLRYRVKGVDYLVVALTQDGPVPVRY